MNQQEILEFNRRCAKFLNYSSPITDKDFYFVEKEEYNKKSSIPKLLELNFEKRFFNDWNWIMEICEAIENLSVSTIMGTKSYSSFKIDRYSIKFYFVKNNDYLLHLELKPYIIDEYIWKHPMYKHHIIKEFDFKNKSKKEAVVEAVNLFLIWYETTNNH